MREMFATNRRMAEAIPLYFSVSDRIPWQVGILRFNRTIDRALKDIDIVNGERREKYRVTLDEKIRSVVSLSSASSDTNSVIKVAFGELTIERLENFHDALILSGRSYSLERSRVEVATESISDLISEIGNSDSDIDAFIFEKLSDLLTVVERYELFGQEGVRDYVNALVGATVTGVLEIKGPIPEQVKTRVLKVIGVSKGIMDAFVYLATGAQAIEWVGAHLALFGGPSELG